MLTNAFITAHNTLLYITIPAFIGMSTGVVTKLYINEIERMDCYTKSFKNGMTALALVSGFHVAMCIAQRNRWLQYYTIESHNKDYQ